MIPSRQGLALLIVLGVLGVLATLGVAFVTMAQLERKASQQRLLSTKALMLARSGLEDAQARLSAGQDPCLAQNAYGGENWDGSADGLLSAFEADQQLYRVTPAGTAADTDSCPVRQALRPSFFVSALPSPMPATQTLDGRMRGFSGRLGGDRTPFGNLYALKVAPQGGFYLNGGDPAALPSAGYNAVLRRMLGTLAEAIDREDGVAGNGPLSAADGLNLVDRRPSDGWRDWDQVRTLALGGDPGKLGALKPYLALTAWVDRKVIAPNAVEPPAGGQPYHSRGEVRLDRPVSDDGRAPAFECLGTRVVGRAPVDLAWARTRRPALVALFAGLKGAYVDETAASPQAAGDLLGKARTAELANAWTPTDDCHLAVDRLLACTSELTTWDRWSAFCDAIPFTGTSEIIQAKRDLLKANFNPNSDLNKFSPNASLWRSVDKSDLLVYSTEFSLLPGVGALEVESAGRLTDPDGRLLASRVLQASVASSSRLTLTTQGEFVCEELGEPSLAGDERTVRLPGRTPFITRSAGPGNTRTWGHALAAVGSPGISLQTYPEPCVDPGSGLELHPARYDGSVQLATLETPMDDMYLVTSTTQDMKLLARYTTGFDLDVADATQAPFSILDGNKNQTDVQQVTPAELGNGLLDAVKPNTLHPDGVYAERDRCPAYFDLGNAHPAHGLVSFWIKSDHQPPQGSGWVCSGHPFLKRTNAMNDSLGKDQGFYLADSLFKMGGGSGRFVSCHYETSHSKFDISKEHGFQREGELTPHLWQLLTLAWDCAAPQVDDCGELLINAGLTASDLGSTDDYVGDGHDNDPMSFSDITLDDVNGRHLLTLGRSQPGQDTAIRMWTCSGAIATFDELALYDFGGADPAGIPAEPATLNSPGVLASNRFKEGRYYRESAYTGLFASSGMNRAGEYFSPLIRLGGTFRIKALAWTQVVPQELPNAGIRFELVDAPGADYLPDASGRPIDRTFDLSRGSTVSRRVGTPFRLHAVFQPNLDPATLQDTPILNPLALDDVTVIYEPVGGRRILDWYAP